MTMTPATIIAAARDTLNDEDSELYRTSDAKLVAFVNAGLGEVSRLAPQLFNTLGDFDCIANQCDQTINFSDAQAIVDVLCIHGGNVVPECDMATMDAFLPGWRSAAAGAAINWMRKPNDPLRFFIYPQAPADQTLDVMYVKNPATVALNDVITELPDSLQSALALYLIWRCDWKDDEHANSGRAAASYQAFVAMVKGAPA